MNKSSPERPQELMAISKNGSNYAGGGGGNGHIINPSSSQQPSNNGPNCSSSLHEEEEEQEVEVEVEQEFLGYRSSNNLKKKVGLVQARYKECLKNHAASIGGNATDGCGEFMPSGEEGTLEALKCSACNCHRNFHRKLETDNAHALDSCSYRRSITRLILGQYPHPNTGFNVVSPPQAQGYPPANSLRPTPSHPQQHIIVSYGNGLAAPAALIPSESDERDIEDHINGVATPTGPPHHAKMKKRVRTKFTEEQKEKMLNFAQKAGWKMQKLEEAFVQQFCQEIGIKRRVLKVWMHNNKHHFDKNNNDSSSM